MTTPSSLTADVALPVPNGKHARLITLLGILGFSAYVALSGIPGVAIAVQFQRIAPEAKEVALGTVAAIGSLVGVILGPTWGTISDRMRTRWGRRTPIIAIGAAVAIGGLVILATAQSVPAILVGVVVAETGFTAVQAPVIATLPDRIPHRVRGFAAAVLAFGIMLGGAVGQIFGSQLVKLNVPLTYAVGGVLFLLVTVVFVTVNREQSSCDAVLARFDIRQVLRTFWVSPRRYPDFAWAFWSRACMFLGFSSVGTFGLYILQDYVGLDEQSALDTVGVVAGLNVLGVLISISISGALSDRVGRRKPFVVVASTIAGVAAVFPLAIPTVTGILIFAFVTGLSYGAFLSVDQALITEVLPSQESAAKDLGIANIASGGALALGPVLATIVITQFHVYPPLFIVSLVLSVLGGVLVLPIRGAR